MIYQCMNEREQFKLMHVKNDLRRIMVLSNTTKFRLANHVRIRSLSRRNMTKETKEIPMNVFQHVPLF